MSALLKILAPVLVVAFEELLREAIDED